MQLFVFQNRVSSLCPYLMLVFLFLFSTLRAEEDSLRLLNNLRCELKGQYGFVYPHHTTIGEVVEKTFPEWN